MEELKFLKGYRENLPNNLNNNSIYITITENEEVYTSIYINGKEWVSKPNVITKEGNTLSLVVSANTIYNCGTLSSLTITSIPNSELESLIYFTTSSECQVILPDCEIVGDIIIDPNKKYVFSILNGILIMGEINNYE